MDEEKIKIELLPDAERFLLSLPRNVMKKIAYIIARVQHGEKDSEIFKKLSNSNIWEFRAEVMGVCYRLFAFWDTVTNSLIVVTHGIVKKTRKTPQREIDNAERIRKEYLNDKLKA